MSFAAKVILGSTSPYTKKKIHTLQLRYPRFIHAEFMTHRVFGRNASSSRAIPVKRLIEDIRRDPGMPIYWGRNKPGMQAGEDHNEPVRDPYSGELVTREEGWRRARESQILWAQSYDEAGYHKQIVNRRIENDGHINVVVTATEWDNFFLLRDHPDAQPEIRELAVCMKEVMADYRCEERRLHLPYILDEEMHKPTDQLGAVSSARCARVSYMTHEGKHPNWDDDLELSNKLSGFPPHLSPFEHQAIASQLNESYANLRGWIHQRNLLENNVLFI